MIREVLVQNANMFAWIVVDMLGVDPNITSHQLSVYKDVRPVWHRRKESLVRRRKKQRRKKLRS